MPAIPSGYVMKRVMSITPRTYSDVSFSIPYDNYANTTHVVRTVPQFDWPAFGTPDATTDFPALTGSEVYGRHWMHLAALFTFDGGGISGNTAIPFTQCFIGAPNTFSSYTNGLWQGQGTPAIGPQNPWDYNGSGGAARINDGTVASYGRWGGVSDAEWGYVAPSGSDAWDIYGGASSESIIFPHIPVGDGGTLLRSTFDENWNLFGANAVNAAIYDSLRQFRAGDFVLGGISGGWPFLTPPPPDEEFTLSCELYGGALVWGPAGGGGDDPLSLYGLSMDLHPFGVRRMVYNVGFNTTALKLRRYYGPTSTGAADASLPFAGQSPDILCMNDGRHLIAVSDGMNININQVDDEGSVIAAMPSPGTGKLCCIYTSRDDAASPVWVGFCTTDTGTGDLKVYRALDPVGLTGWEAAVTVVSGAPAQKPTITGDLSRLLLAYHDGSGNPQTMYSIDSGASWTLST